MLRQARTERMPFIITDCPSVLHEHVSHPQKKSTNLQPHKLFFFPACLITPVLPLTSQISLFLLSGLHRTTVQGRNAHVPDPTKPSCAGEIYNFRICTATVQSGTCLHIVLVLTFHCILLFKSYFLHECLIPLPQRKHLVRYKRPNSVTLHFVALFFLFIFFFLLLGIQHLKAYLQVYFLQMVIVNLSEVG